MGTGNCLIQPGEPVENLVIELLDLAGWSLSILRLHVNFGDLCYGPYPGKDEDKVYKSVREVPRRKERDLDESYEKSNHQYQSIELVTKLKKVEH